MGIILKPLFLHGLEKRRRVKALFDSGSSKSLIREQLARMLGPLVELPEPERFEMARGEFSVREGFVGSVALKGAKLAHLFCVVPQLTEELIIGADFLQQWDVHIHPRRKKITIDPRALKLKAVGNRLRRG